MTGRRVFFSFHYEQDVWRASNVRNASTVDARAAAGWVDASLWEKAKSKGDREIRRLIDDGLSGTTVTAVLIGSETASRPWVTYEIEKSIERGNGLIGVRIHKVRNSDGLKGKRGPVPAALQAGGHRVYDWNRTNFGRRVEFAALDAGKPCLNHDSKDCFICRWLWLY